MVVNLASGALVKAKANIERRPGEGVMEPSERLPGWQMVCRVYFGGLKDNPWPPGPEGDADGKPPSVSALEQSVNRV